MDYFKKYLKYKKKYMDLKSQMKVNVEISDENKLGLVKLNNDKIYVISGIICCIGIIIRSFNVDALANLNLLDGLSVHFIDGLDERAHFTDEGLTESGGEVIDVLKRFILENRMNNIQLDLVTNSRGINRHPSTKNMIERLKSLFILFIKDNSILNFEIKETYDIGRLEFDPKTWNF